MFIGYSHYSFKPLMSQLHRKYPQLNIVYLGNVDANTINMVLASNNISIYLYSGPQFEPYLTYQIWNNFKGKIISMSKYFRNGDFEDEFDTELFYFDLQTALSKYDVGE